MINEIDNLLQPYPIDEKQDKVVNRIVRLREKGLIRRIENFVSNKTCLCINQREKEEKENIERKSANEIVCPVVCTSIDSMDSKYYYVIREGKIWFKPIGANENAEWKLFDENGYTNKRKIPLICLSADGDNLIAVDLNNEIYYTKTNKVICQISFDCPKWKIIQSSVKWNKKWFSMDGVSLIINLFKNPILNRIPNCKSLVISHKGVDTMYYTDMNGKKHPDPYIGVTTIYTLNHDGTRIFFADPWLYNKFGNEITTPEDGQFKGETLVASASTLMIIQRAKNEFGQEINQIYTRFADFDSIGSNPALRSTYNKTNILPMIRYLPSEDWTKQPSIDLQGKARLTKNLAILQIGWGQNNRQLRVQGQNYQGINGYYFKNIYQSIWTFQPTQHIQIDQTQFLSDHFPWTGFEKAQKITEDYQKGIIKYPILNIQFKITLEKFSRKGLNERGLHTKIVFTLEDNFKLLIELHARRGWKSLLGISDKVIWKITIQEQYYQIQNNQIQIILSEIFRNKRVIPVNVYEQQNQITIQNLFGYYSKFRFDFTNQIH